MLVGQAEVGLEVPPLLNSGEDAGNGLVVMVDP